MVSYIYVLLIFCSCSQPSVNLMSLKEFMEFCTHFVNMKCNFYTVLLSARKWNSFMGFQTIFLNITTKSIPTYSIIYTLKHFFNMLIYCNGKTKLHPLFYTSGKGYKYIQRWTITHDIYYVIIYLTKSKLKCRSTTQTTTHDSVACRTTSPCRDKRYWFLLCAFLLYLSTQNSSRNLAPSALFT